jgi:uncharacterized protein YgiM (DUF1202 family)
MKFHTISNVICLAILTGLLANTAPGFAQSGPGGYGNVSRVYSCSRDGDIINLRARAGQQYRVLTKIPSGQPVVLIGITKVVGEFTWQKVNFYGAVGWVRGDFLCN